MKHKEMNVHFPAKPSSLRVGWKEEMSRRRYSPERPGEISFNLNGKGSWNVSNRNIFG